MRQRLAAILRLKILSLNHHPVLHGNTTPRPGNPVNVAVTDVSQ